MNRAQRQLLADRVVLCCLVRRWRGPAVPPNSGNIVPGFHYYADYGPDIQVAFPSFQLHRAAGCWGSMLVLRLPRLLAGQNSYAASLRDPVLVQARALPQKKAAPTIIAPGITQCRFKNGRPMYSSLSGRSMRSIHKYIFL